MRMSSKTLFVRSGLSELIPYPSCS